MPLASPNNPIPLNLMYGEEKVVLSVVTPFETIIITTLAELRECLVSNRVTRFQKSQIRLMVK